MSGAFDYTSSKGQPMMAIVELGGIMEVVPAK
jgi:hypothetical protein